MYSWVTSCWWRTTAPRLSGSTSMKRGQAYLRLASDEDWRAPLKEDLTERVEESFSEMVEKGRKGMMRRVCTKCEAVLEERWSWRGDLRGTRILLRDSCLKHTTPSRDGHFVAARRRLVAIRSRSRRRLAFSSSLPGRVSWPRVNTLQCSSSGQSAFGRRQSSRVFSRPRLVDSRRISRPPR